MICEEKHMGSRAVVLLTRDPSPLRCARRAGAVPSTRARAGRSSTRRRPDEFLSRLDPPPRRPACGRNSTPRGFCSTAELLPWSLKAGAMIREQYASGRGSGDVRSPGSRARAPSGSGDRVSMSPTCSTRTRRRASKAADAYSRLVPALQPAGLGARRRAARTVPAARLEGASHLGRDHAWHLAVADRLADADAGADPSHPSIEVDLTSPESEAAATAWWEELTDAGGEGMVVKPLAGLDARNASRSRSPASRCEGQSTCALSTARTTSSQPTSSACATGTSGTSARWRSANTHSALRRSSDSSPRNRYGECTRLSSACSQWSPSQLTPDCEIRIRNGDGASRRTILDQVGVGCEARSQKLTYSKRATSSIVPTMLSFRSSRSSAGIQYSRIVSPPTCCTS